MRVQHLSLTAIFWLASTALCHSQIRQPATAGIDWDIRSESSANGRGRAGLYSGEFHFKAGVAAGWNVEIHADRKDAELQGFGGPIKFLMQQAAVEREWSSQRLQLG